MLAAGKPKLRPRMVSVYAYFGGAANGSLIVRTASKLYRISKARLR